MIEVHDGKCPLCGRKATIRKMDLPRMGRIVNAVASPECRWSLVCFDKDAYPEITRPDLPHGDKIRAALRARVKDTEFGTFAHPITLADLRALRDAA